MTAKYKDDGFDLSLTKEKPRVTIYAIVDLQDLKILGLYDDEELVSLEIEKLENSLSYVVTVMDFPRINMNCPIAIEA